MEEYHIIFDQIFARLSSFNDLFNGVCEEEIENIKENTIRWRIILLEGGMEDIQQETKCIKAFK